MGKNRARAAPSPRELWRRLAPTMVTHDLPSSLQTDILQIVVAAFLVLLQRTALLVAPAAVVALVRLPHCGKNESIGSDPRLLPSPNSHLRHNQLLWWKDTSERLLKPLAFLPALFSHRTRLLPPTGCFAPSVSHTNKRCSSLGGKANKQMLRGGNTNQLNHTPAPSLLGKKLLMPLAHGMVAFIKMSCPSGLILLPTARKPITLREGISLRMLCQNYSGRVGK